MTQLRILQLIDSLKVGGAEILLRDLVFHLHESGQHVHVGFSTPGPLQKSLEEMQVSMTHLPRFARIDPFLFWGMCRLILRERPDIVHTHLFKSDFHGRLAARICKVPVVISTAHNNDSWAQRFPLGNLYGLTTHMADRVIAVSEEVREHQIRYTHTPPEKIITIKSGVDVKKFECQHNEGLRIRTEFGLSPSTPLIGIVGRLQPQKDHATFLRAARSISDALPDARFLIVGDGPLRDDLTNQARTLNLLPSVIFCGIRQDIPAILSALDLLVFSSKWEGLPVALMEGMAAGKPIVSTNVGGISGVVIENETAILVPPNDPVALANACLRILQDRSLAQRFGNAGLARIREKYSLNAMLHNTQNLYEELWDGHLAKKNSHRL